MTSMDETHPEPTAMTNRPSPLSARPEVRARTLPLQGVVNQVVRGLLRAPFLSRLVGKRLVTLYIVGRKSGRRYAVPVAYMEDNGDLLVATQFPWVRNLRTGEGVEIRLRGKRRPALVRIVKDQTGVVERLEMMASENHQFARFNKIRIKQDGDPVPEDLELAWSAGARVAVLTPR
jgi:deazaflavin-dependent oxidoreductase (nitroreductase family)